jgi:hypothetical protein
MGEYPLDAHSDASRIVLSYSGGQLSAENTARLVAGRAMLDEHHQMIRAIIKLQKAWPDVREGLNELHRMATARTAPPNGRA